MAQRCYDSVDPNEEEPPLDALFRMEMGKGKSKRRAAGKDQDLREALEEAMAARRPRGRRARATID